MKPQTILLIIFTFLSFFATAYSQKTFEIPSGKNFIHVKAFGNGKPILIINGGPGMNSEGFEYLAGVLGKKYKAILFDQRGTGQSHLKQVDSSTISMAQMVEDIEAIRKYFKIKSWIVFGHSFGGMLGSYYTSKFPDRTQGLILSSSGGVDMSLFSSFDITANLSVSERDSFNYWNKKITEGDTSYAAMLQKARFLAPAYLFYKTDSTVNLIAKRLTQLNPNINSLVFKDMTKTNFDCSKDLKKYRNPVLVIQGKYDIIPEKIALKTSALLKNCEVAILDNCGHYGWLDQQKLYFDKVLSFLKTVPEA